MNFEQILPCAHVDYGVVVYPYALGQFRIQIVDANNAFNVHREMCTYKWDTARSTVTQLIESDDPLGTAETFATPWNCEYKGGRIRLDNSSPGMYNTPREQDKDPKRG